MTVLYIVLIILALAVAAVLFVRMSLLIKLTKPNDGDFTSELTLKVLGQDIDLKQFIESNDKPSEKKAGHSDENKPDKKKLSLRERLHKLCVNIQRGRYTYLLSKRYVRKKIRIKRIDFDMTFGLDDAAHTGIATGAAWGSVYNILGFLDRLCTVKDHKFNITPVFDGECLSVDFESEIRFSLSNVMAIALAVFSNYLKAKRKIK